MSEIETLTEEERDLAESVIAEIESSEQALDEGTDVGRPEEPAVLRKMQRAYTALVVNHAEQLGTIRAQAAGIAELRGNWDACHEQHKAALASLDQVRAVLQRAEERARQYPGLTGSTYYAAYLEILALVPPPP